MTRVRLAVAALSALASSVAACGGEGSGGDSASAAASATASATASAGASAVARPPGNPDPAQNSYAPALGVDLAKFQKTASGVLYHDVEVGFGTEATAAKRVQVHYTGWLPDGTRFESSHDRGTPLEFMLGAGQVIAGWDEGLVGMKLGGRRKLVLPAALAYGEAGSPPDVPPNSVLVFEVELMGVQ